ncbi:tRNA-splicing ligase RtcB [uncultured archaeon]|nr:tRNA-splicing ligase RtcB [uncultured archaeon]
MVGLADLKKHFEIVKKCQMSLNDKYCYFSLSGVNTLDFLDIVNYKSWVFKTFQKVVNIIYVYIIKKLEKGNTIVRTSVGFAPLLMRFLRIKGYQVRDEDIEIFRARNVIFPDFRINLYDFQERMIGDWLSAGSIGVLKSPTGSGKTIIGCRAIKETGRKTLILVHTSDLLINVWNDSLIKSFGPGIMSQVGVVGGGLTDKDRAAMRLGVRSGDFDENIRKDIVIATFQTFVNHINEISQYKFGLILVDECIPIDSDIWTQDGIIKYEDLGHGSDCKRDVFQVWSKDKDDNLVNNGYKKITTRFKHMYRTIVETGDELVCSLDHKVLTRKNDGTEEFVEIEKARNVARSLMRPCDMREDCIIARIFGYMLGDGWIDINLQGGAGGDNRGLSRMSYDMKKLGYPSGIGKERELSSNINSVLYGNLEVNGSVSSIKLNKYLTDRLIKLGFPIGRKTNQNYCIPDWIMSGSRDIKREVLAGYLGAEGTNPGFRGGEDNNLKKSFFVPRFAIYKRSDLVGGGINLAEQLRELLSEFDINVSNIDVKDGNIRKDGSITKKIIVTIGNEVDNLRRYLDIGYRYCPEKEKEGELIGLYLAYIDECNKERKEIRDKVLELYNKGTKKRDRIICIVNSSRTSSQKDIISSWGLEEESREVIKKKYLVHATDGIVSDILYPHKRDDGTEIIAENAKIQKYMYDFDVWKSKVSGDFIFLDILRHEYRGYEQGHTLTVDRDHNYLVNGFNVKNCHHCPAQMFRKVNAVIRAPYKLGLSATIDRMDGMTRDVFGQLGDVQSKVSIRELINRGILAEPRFQSPIIVDHGVTNEVQDSGLSGLKYSRLIKKKSASSQKKKDFIVNTCKNIAARDRKFLLFTDYVNAEDVFVRDMYASSLIDEGVNVNVIDQGMTSDERSSVFGFLESGDISGIIFGKLGSEGVNIPSVDVVVMANAIKSPITYTQRVGRAMRRVPGKDWCDVYEVLLDLPTELKWSDFNFAEYRAEGFQKLVYKVE